MGLHPRTAAEAGKKMMRYEFIIYWSKADESFIVEVPELPGCIADGLEKREGVCAKA